jgi:acetyltransferase-like isoleucine patch superfamily enzyme
MRTLANYILRKLKGPGYLLDQRIPIFYLAGVAIDRLLMAFRGAMSGIDHRGVLFIGSHVTIKAKRFLKAGRTVTIGSHCFIDALSTDGVKLGENVSMGNAVRIACTGSLQQIGKGMQVGDNVGLGADNFFGCAGGISIGADTIIGNFVSFHAENHIYSDPTTPIRLQGASRRGISVGQNCWIGARVTVLDGAIIEDGCIVAAGAVLTEGTYRANGIYAGVPAKRIGNRCEATDEHKFLTCNP